MTEPTAKDIETYKRIISARCKNFKEDEDISFSQLIEAIEEQAYERGLEEAAKIAEEYAAGCSEGYGAEIALSIREEKQ